MAMKTTPLQGRTPMMSQSSQAQIDRQRQRMRIAAANRRVSATSAPTIKVTPKLLSQVKASAAGQLPGSLKRFA